MICLYVWGGIDIQRSILQILPHHQHSDVSRRTLFGASLAVWDHDSVSPCLMYLVRDCVLPSPELFGWDTSSPELIHLGRSCLCGCRPPLSPLRSMTCLVVPHPSHTGSLCNWSPVPIYAEGLEDKEGHCISVALIQVDIVEGFVSTARSNCGLTWGEGVVLCVWSDLVALLVVSWGLQ